MIRFLAVLLLALGPASVARALVGDIYFARTTADGWCVELGVEGFNTNANFFPNYEANPRTPASPALWIEGTSMGYDTNATPVQVAQRFIGTKVLRRPYPDSTISTVSVLDIFAAGTNSVYKIPLHEMICARDSNLVLYARSGAIGTTNVAGAITTNSLAAYGITVTNLSTQRYGVAGVGIAHPGWDGSTNLLRLVRAIAAGPMPHHFDGGQPVAALRVSHVDQHGNTQTNNIPGMRIDWNYGDQVPFGEYICDYYQTNFTEGDLITSTITAVGWLGDETTTMTETVTNLCNRGGYGTGLYAVVDGLAGNDATGALSLSDNPAAMAAAAFATYDAAFARVAASNAVLWAIPHNDVGNCKIYGRAGSTNWTGGSSSWGTNNTWAISEVTAYPGESLVITNRVGNRNPGLRLKFSGVEFGVVGAAVPFYQFDTLVTEDCIYNSSATAGFQNITNWMIIGGRASNFTAGFIGNNAATKLKIFRGVNLNGFSGLIHSALMAGCLQDQTNGCRIRMDSEAAGGWLPRFPILYNNRLEAFNASSDCVTWGTYFGITNGGFIGQNTFAYYTNNQTPSLMFVGTKNTGYFTNVYFVGNLMVGKRFGLSYDDAGATASIKAGWMVRNNVGDIPGWKTDTWTGDPNGARIGNWSLINGVACSGNIWLHRNVDQAAGTLFQDFMGFEGYVTTALPWTNTIAFPRFVDDRAWPNSYAGGGNFRWQADSPVVTLKATHYFPYDIAGVPRGKFDPPGPYCLSNPRRSVFAH